MTALPPTSSSQGTLAATYAYDTFGTLTATTGGFANPFRYTSREFDADTGLYFYRARYYDPDIGRFMSEDPIRFAGGINFYAYVHNNPLTMSDPLGLRPLTACEKDKLRPYIPDVDLDNADLHENKVPWYTPPDARAITRNNDIYVRPGFYDPSIPGGLALLGHELLHVGQYRNGMTWPTYLLSPSKYEKPAYAQEERIRDDLTNSGSECCKRQ